MSRPATEGGTLLATTGTEQGEEVRRSGGVLAAAVLDAGKGQLIGAAFVVDSKIEDHYKETVKGICQTLRRADDFGKR